ncbi:MAG: flagellar hook-associated protein FlgK [Acidimicrobiales bacterium]
MSDLGLYIAASGIQAQTIGLDSVNEDLANVNTPGYERQRVNLSPLTANQMGSGVGISSIENVSSALANAQAMSTGAASSSAAALSQLLSTAQAAFPEPSSSGLQSQLSSFWSTWDTLGNDPTNSAARQQVVDAGQLLVNSLHTASQTLAATSAQATQQIGSTLTNDNKVLGEVAQLNQSVAEAQPLGGGAALVDQRNQLLTQLSNDLGVTTSEQPNGSVTVYLQGVMLVQGNQAVSLRADPSSSSLVDVYDQPTDASPLASASAGGTVGGLGAAIGTLTSSSPTSLQSQLDAVASSLAGAVNNQLGKGYYYATGSATGTAGVPLFQTVGLPPVTAANITLNPAVAADPTELAAASSATSGPNDGTNAQAMAELATAPTGASGGFLPPGPAGFSSPDALYQVFIGQLGTVVAGASASATATANQAKAATAAQQAISGVDPNEEMVQMLAYQNAYQASAKALSTVNATIQSLLAAV